ncbi:MAG: hypothetical protein GXO91_02960 [FCB group bacterium]|nr:hypothetical protein [FCB group bacterium]
MRPPSPPSKFKHRHPTAVYSRVIFDDAAFLVHGLQMAIRCCLTTPGPFPQVDEWGGTILCAGPRIVLNRNGLCRSQAHLQGTMAHHFRIMGYIQADFER